MSTEVESSPPAIRPFHGGIVRKVVITVALLAFVYGVWQIIVQMRADRTAAIVLALSFVVLFAMSIAASLQHRREVRAWIQEQRERDQSGPKQ
jgi:hypothetical protein